MAPNPNWLSQVTIVIAGRVVKLPSTEFGEHLKTLLEQSTDSLILFVIDGKIIKMMGSENILSLNIPMLLESSAESQLTLILEENPEFNESFAALTDGWNRDEIDALNTRITEIETSNRTQAGLGHPRAGEKLTWSQPRIDFVWQLVQMTEAEFLKRKNLGRKSLNELREILLDLNLEMGQAAKIAKHRHLLRTE